MSNTTVAIDFFGQSLTLVCEDNHYKFSSDVVQDENANGQLNSWIKNSSNESLLTFNNKIRFQFDNEKIVTLRSERDNKKNPTSHGSFGVFSDVNNQNRYCVFAPIWWTSESKSELNISDKSVITVLNNGEKCAPFIFIAKIDKDADGNQSADRWFAYVRSWENYGFNRVLRLISPFENNIILSAINTSHLVSFPVLSVGEQNFPKSYPVFTFEVLKDVARLIKISSFKQKANQSNVELEFKNRVPNSLNKLKLINGNIKNSKILIKEDEWTIGPNQNSKDLASYLFIQNCLIKDLETIQNSTLPIETFRFDLEIEFNKVDMDLINGSMAFTQSGQSSTATTLKVNFTGNWDRFNKNNHLYPEFEVTHIPCSFSFSPLADLVAQNNNAVFDTNSLKEYELHREGGVLLGEFKNINQVKDATLNIRIKTQKDRNAIVEWSIKGKQKSNNTTLKPKALYFQAKPFSVAQIEFPDHDPEGGEKIAFWRSDDPEGAQWRIADSEITIHLPPQAVGEEMERGNRFWIQNDATANLKPYIEPTEPIKYRFSPPTTLTVMPGTKVRRYNAAPNNLQTVLKEAIVKSFDTEIVYPVNTKFAVNSEGLPHIRISDTAFFTGKPTENLPPYVASDSELIDLYRDALANEIALYTSEKSGLLERDANKKNETSYKDFKTNFKKSYKYTRLAHSAVKANWASRIAQYHLYDPYRADGKLMLSQGLTFKIRSTKEDAPPLINPLPNGITVLSWITEIENFLTNYPNEDDHKDFIKNEDKDSAKKHGALRAGVIYTIEFESVLRAVLTNNNATSTVGIIEELSFTSLGANGYISVEFDEGRTKFKARVHHGQISRLENIRIGRLGVLWNKARHVIVYERTTVPSKQFKEEQGNDGNNSFKGWPIIRKTEEYVEPIEVNRKFQTEASKDINACGFVESSEFISQKIYVNSAWGKNYEHGYEVPLWKADETNSVYVKPSLALNAHAGIDETTKQLLDEPQYLFFYSNTQAGTGKDSNNWQAQVEIDLPSGLCRLPVITGTHLKSDPQRIISSKEIPQPNTSVSARRPRFDLAVKSTGPVNLQHKRGETQMLAAIQVISMARTGEVATKEEIKEKIKEITNSESIRKLWGSVSSVNQDLIEVKGLYDRLAKDFLEKLQAGGSIDCKEIAEELDGKAKKFLEGKRSKLKGNLNVLTENFSNVTKQHSYDAINKILAIRVDYPQDYSTKYSIQLAQSARDGLAEYKSQLAINTIKLKQDLDRNLAPIIKFLESVDKTLSKRFAGITNDEFNKLIIPNIPSDSKENVEKYVSEINDQYLAELKKYRGKNGLLDLIIDHLEKYLSTQIVLLAGVTKSGKLTDDIKILITEINGYIDEINKELDGFNNFFVGLEASVDELNKISKSIQGNILKLRAWLEKKGEEIKNEINDIFDYLSDQITSETNLLRVANEVDKKISAYNQTLDIKLNDVVKNINLYENQTISKIVNIESRCIEFSDNSFAIIDKEVTRLIYELENDCTDATQLLKDFLGTVNKKLAESKEEVTAFVEQYIDKKTQQEIQELAKNFEEKAESGIKLFKAIGDLPKLPSLDFNALAAEYVFGDVDKFIETSPYAVKLKEIDSALNGLGITLPSSQLFDQIVPSSLNGLNFRDVFNNMGGMDFKHLFAKFKLDDKLKSDNIKIAHGLDKETRQAWVKASVNAEFPKKQSLFDVASIGISTTNLKLNAISEQRVDLQGKREFTNKGKFTSDFALDYSGNKLAVFKEVTISFDNGKFDFDISPDKIELHPSIKFVSEISKQIQGNLPPYIEVVKDGKGNTKGVRSSMNIEVTNPPDFGAVKIGTLIMYSGIQLEMTDNDSFQISSFLSVGKKETPIFLQVGELGGGLWLDTTTTQIGPTTSITANLGLAVGNTRRKNIGGVANGEYSILLYAYANYLVSNVNTRSQFTAGISIYGSARVLSIANATISMILEAIHDSQSGTKGRGVLDVKISMGRFYKIKIKKQVEQKI